MESKSRLIYKSDMTCFDTFLPVHFYGMSNGKMVVLFASSKTDFAYNTIRKWILVDHLDFSYDYESDTIFTNGSEEVGIEEFMLLADNLEQRIKTIATFGNFSTKAEAQQYYKMNLNNILFTPKLEHVEMYY